MRITTAGQGKPPQFAPREVNETPTTTPTAEIPSMKSTRPHHTLRATPTARITKTETFCFFEIRSRGADSVYAVSDGVIHNRRGSLALPGDVVECIKSSTRIWFKRNTMYNIATPYLVVRRGPRRGEESIFAARSYSIVTTLQRRRSFLADVSAIVSECSNNVAYMMSALKITETVFLSMVEHGNIPESDAERTYTKFDSIFARVLGGSTAHERRTAYEKALALLTRAINLNSKETFNV